MPFTSKLFEPVLHTPEPYGEEDQRLREFRGRYWSHESVEFRTTFPVERSSNVRYMTPVREPSDPVLGTPGHASSSSSSRPMNNRNAVDLERVQNGLDVRTTVRFHISPIINRIKHSGCADTTMHRSCSEISPTAWIM